MLEIENCLKGVLKNIESLRYLRKEEDNLEEILDVESAIEQAVDIFGRLSFEAILDNKDFVTIPRY